MGFSKQILNSVQTNTVLATRAQLLVLPGKNLIKIQIKFLTQGISSIMIMNIELFLQSIFWEEHDIVFNYEGVKKRSSAEHWENCDFRRILCCTGYKPVELFCGGEKMNIIDISRVILQLCFKPCSQTKT